jgi:hypothetical protein
MVSDFGEQIGVENKTYDADGSLRESKIAVKGSVQRVDKYAYEGGRQTEVLTYDSKGVLRQKTTKAYDAIGNVVSETYFDPVMPRAKTVFRYDENGNVSEATFFLNDGKKAIAPIGPCLGAHRVTYQYDSNKRVVASSAFEEDGKEKKSWAYKYDERGNYLVYSIKSAYSVTRITYSHEYDSKGNWTKRTSVSENDDGFLEQMLKATGKKATPEELKTMKDRAKITHVTIREITYYPGGN